MIGPIVANLVRISVWAFQPDGCGPRVFHPGRMIGLVLCRHSNPMVEGQGYSNRKVDWTRSMLFVAVCVCLCVYGYFGGTH